MLVELQISNFAIIDHQTVTFDKGLNVISGETGAGKSIILNALELILGVRPKQHSVREGADALEIQALFDLTTLDERSRNELPDIARGEELAIVRSISQSGKGRVYINGKLATVALLEEFSSKLINICGQSHHVRLLDPRFHLQLVDEFAGNGELLRSYQERFTQWRQSEDLLENFERRLRESEARRGGLEELVAELEGAELRAGLREELESKVKKLSNAERLIQGVSRIVDSFTDEAGIFSSMTSVGAELSDLSKFDDSLKKTGELFHSAFTELKEFHGDLQSYLRSMELDEEELEQLREKLAEVARLERKYRTNSEGLLELLESSKNELSQLGDAINIEQLRKRVEAEYQQVLELGTTLSSSRKGAGEQLGLQVKGELRELNMKDVSLSLALASCSPTSMGLDKGELLLSSNKGQAMKPLRQIASGGELSRITLVLKKILRDRSGVNVLVFDEVDTGVSGQVARAVGIKLKELAKDSQVICITHLPQVASLADQHLRVEKRVEDERTRSVVTKLSADQRVEEVARMLAGYKITEAARESARELLGNE